MPGIRIFASAICVLAVSVAASPAAAQGGGSQQPTTIESITVTAEKTEADLQDTALSIQALSAKDLETFNVINTADVGGFTPGVNFLQATNGNAQMAFVFRGTGSTDNNPIVASTVGLYVDGVYIGTGNGTQFDLLDIQRIETLKGPQGTLFGRNTIGGAINVTSIKPGPEFGGSARVRIGQHGERVYRGSLNVPLLSETLFSRLSFISRDRDPWNSPKAGEDQDDVDQMGGRLALRWTPTSALTIDYALDRIKIDNHNPSFHASEILRQGTGVCVSGAFAISGADCVEQSLGLPAGTVDSSVRRDHGPIATDGEQFIKFDVWQNSLTLTLDVSENLELKSISGWRKYKMSGQNDLDGTPFSIFHSGQHINHRTFYQELQLVGSVMDGFMDFATGVTWFEEETDADNFSDLLSDGNAQMDADAGFPFDISNTAKTQQDAWAWGAYTQNTMHLTDALDLSLGLRYSKERKEIERSLCGSNRALVDPQRCAALNPFFNPTFSFSNDVRDTRFDNWSPMARLQYSWSDDIMSWVSWTRGYRSGGFNARPGDASAGSLDPFKEETVSQWETGMKTRWLDNRLQINWSGFYSEYDDQQIAIFTPSSGTSTFILNAGKSRIRGYEIDVRAVPIDGLTLYLTHGFTRADFSEFIGVDPTNPGPGVQNLADQQDFATQPKRTYAGAATYTFPATDLGTLVVTGKFQRMDRLSFLTNKAQARAIKASHWTTYGARVALENALGHEGLTLALIGQNLTDRDYRTNGINFSSALYGAGHNYGDPRHLAFELSYEFGGI